LGADNALRGLLAVLSLFALSACGGEGGPNAPETSVVAERCLVRLHGKGGDGAAPATMPDGTVVITPQGNGKGWGGREWRYFPAERYEEARTRVLQASSGCSSVILSGFSNGGAFAARLYCAGEDLDGRLLRVVVDDPVTDQGVAGCVPATGVDAVLYWTGALDASSQPGSPCEAIDWTCEGGETVGIEAYSSELGVEWKPSPERGHIWFQDAPELSDW